MQQRIVANRKYALLLIILILHQFFRYLGATSRQKSLEFVVSGYGGLNDSFWYLGIAEHGYNFAPGGIWSHQSPYVFYPALSQLVAIGYHLGLPTVWWALFLVTAITFLAAIQLSRLVSLHFGQRVGYFVALLFVGQLYALSLVSIMTESLFALLVFSALLAWGKKQYNQAAIIVMFACLTKSFAIALAASLIVSAVVKIRNKDENFRALIVPISLCAVAPSLWVVFVAIKFSDFTKYFALQKAGWGNVFNVGDTFIQFIYQNTFHFQSVSSWALIVTAVCLMTLTLVIWSCTFQVPVEWKVFLVLCFYISIAHQSWHIADARFLTSIGLALFPIAVLAERLQRSWRIGLVVVWLIPSFYISTIALSGF